MDIETKITLTLNVRLDVGHLVVIINPVYHKVREPWVLPTDLEKFIK